MYVCGRNVPRFLLHLTQVRWLRAQIWPGAACTSVTTDRNAVRVIDVAYVIPMDAVKSFLFGAETVAERM